MRIQREGNTHTHNRERAMKDTARSDCAQESFPLAELLSHKSFVVCRCVVRSEINANGMHSKQLDPLNLQKRPFPLQSVDHGVPVTRKLRTDEAQT